VALHGQRDHAGSFANHARLGRVVGAATQRAVQVSDEEFDDILIVIKIEC
jgi:hypothetical protein